jgi:hypothetical protein
VTFTERLPIGRLALARCRHRQTAQHDGYIGRGVFVFLFDLRQLSADPIDSCRRTVLGGLDDVNGARAETPALTVAVAQVPVRRSG